MEASISSSTVPDPGFPKSLITKRSFDLQDAVGLIVTLGAVLFVVLSLHPELVLANTTPAGGDMGAHVWGPAFLRDHLIPQWRLSGWTPDWYAGFPAYQFYMVLPALAIVFLDVFLPYGVAFKMVTMFGLAAMPLAAYLFGRLVRMPFPGPPLMAIAATMFLFDRSFTIYGGNIASTMAGEFSFTIALAFALVYLGVVIRGLHTGRHRALAAVLLAIVVLCHVIPAVFALLATIVVAVVYGPSKRDSYLSVVGWSFGFFGMAAAAWAPTRSHDFLMPALFLVSFADIIYMVRSSTKRRAAAVLSSIGIILIISEAQGAVWAIVVVFGAVFLFAEVFSGRQRLIYLISTGAVGSALTGFWAIPFIMRRGYMTNMGYEKATHYLEGLFPGRVGSALTEWFGGTHDATVTGDITVVLVLALVGAGISLVYRQRLGTFFALSALGFAVAYAVLPEGRLWNPRLLPFWYLNLYLLAAIAVSEAIQSVAVLISDRADHPDRRILAAGPVVAALVGLVVVSLPLRMLPGGKISKDGVTYSWMGLRTKDQSFVRGWAKWNYSGYERKEAFPEYRDLVGTMKWVGDKRGCGRALWEYESELNRFGTPMALMLLPYWTDGCIGSMEGLYFESASTTPYHFMNAAELSKKPSNPQRGLPYGTLDVDKGVKHLQMLGVRYYMAFSPAAIAEADQNQDLTPIATSGAWHVYQVADAALVEGLGVDPAVMKGVDAASDEWLKPSVDWYADETAWKVPLAGGGPKSWPRVRPGKSPKINRVQKAKVTNIEVDTDRVEFDVDRAGTPVLIKMSYFPNWKVSGAKGPWRVTPSFMVVVPTSKHVVLSYETSGVDWFGRLVTLGGAGALVMIARRKYFAGWIDDPDFDPLASKGSEYGASVSLYVEAVESEVAAAPSSGSSDDDPELG